MMWKNFPFSQVQESCLKMASRQESGQATRSRGVQHLSLQSIVSRKRHSYFWCFIKIWDAKPNLPRLTIFCMALFFRGCSSKSTSPIRYPTRSPVYAYADAIFVNLCRKSVPSRSAMFSILCSETWHSFNSDSTVMKHRSHSYIRQVHLIPA